MPPRRRSASGDCTLDEPLKIGYAADFDLGGIGDVPGTKAAQYVVDTINAAGGVGGQQVELEIKQISQTPPDPAAAQRAVQELLDGGADILLGPPFSDYGLPLLEVTQGTVPVLFVTSTEITLSDPAQGSFLVSFDDRVQASAAAEFATKQGYTTAVTLSSSDIPYLNITTAAFTEVFTGAGGTVDKDLSFNLGDTDFSAQVNEIAAMDPQPDAVYSAFFLPEAGIFLKQLREAGVDVDGDQRRRLRRQRGVDRRRRRRGRVLHEPHLPRRQQRRRRVPRRLRGRQGRAGRHRRLRGARRRCGEHRRSPRPWQPAPPTAQR